ncbi:MAG: sigma-70 family RNA polymerase sigma factor [Opitutaceae bacterium]|nr:sigma-70 family RNA polymerase sigma factor [Opitutaceae bacterium]
MPNCMREVNPHTQQGSVQAETGSRDTAVDIALVRRFATGDESAFTEIVSRYRSRIHALTVNLLRNTADAEEITQDTFIRAYRGLSRFRGDSSLSTWLYRIALNLARNRYWYFFRRRRHNWVSLERPLADGSEATFADLVAAEGHDPAQETAASEFTALVATCMERLDRKHREILTMRNVLDLSYEEIARALGINVGTVKSRIARARENLRTLLTEINPELSPAISTADFFLTARAVYGQPAISYA